MGIREILYVHHELPQHHSGHRPWTIEGVIWWSWSVQDLKSLAVLTQGKDPEISIYHPTLPWEVAQRPWRSLSPPSGYGAVSSWCFPSKALLIRYTGVQQHKRYDRVNNLDGNICRQQWYSHDITRPNPCSGSWWSTIWKTN